MHGLALSQRVQGRAHARLHVTHDDLQLIMRVHVAFVILASSFDGLPALSGAIGALVRPRMGPKSSPLDHGFKMQLLGALTGTKTISGTPLFEAMQGDWP